MYATDEKRFSNITAAFGFDKIIGPRMGVNDFLLGSLSDFPLINLLINTPLGQLFFPYQYANRANAITYEPDRFLHLIDKEISLTPNKPVFLAVHLCLSHWPYTWAQDYQNENLTAAEHYQHSVEAADSQLGKLLKILKTRGLLENSLIVLLSDHGTGLGLVGDRLIEKKYYQGDKEKIKWLPLFHLAQKENATSFPEIRLDTSYGQGTDILSLQQHHVLLSFHSSNPKMLPHSVNQRSLLLDIAPTILEYLKLSPLASIDGRSLYSFLWSTSSKLIPRSLVWESGYSTMDIATDKINTHKILAKNIGGYRIHPATTLLSVIPEIEENSVATKQRAILSGDWLLARYPAMTASKLILTPAHTFKFQSFALPAYFVLVNINTKVWSIGITSFPKKAPTDKLLKEFYAFYGDEISPGLFYEVKQVREPKKAATNQSSLGKRRTSGKRM